MQIRGFLRTATICYTFLSIHLCLIFIAMLPFSSNSGLLIGRRLHCLLPPKTVLGWQSWYFCLGSINFLFLLNLFKFNISKYPRHPVCLSPLSPLSSVQARESELTSRHKSLLSINSVGDQIMKDPSTGDTDRHNIQTDLNTLNERWTAVS